MKVFLILLSVFLLFSVTISGGPILQIPQETFDFGKTIQKAVLTHDFMLRSVGDDTLRITNVEPGCGCTKSWLSDSVIAPGDSANLHIIFSTGRYVGLVNKRPYVESNASGEKAFLKVITYLETEPQFSVPVILNPPVVDVSQFDERPRRRAAFLIENRLDEDLSISVVDSSFKSFKVEIPEKVKARESVKGLVIVLKTAVETEFEESVTIELNDPDRTRYSIPVRRTLPPEMRKAAVHNH